MLNYDFLNIKMISCSTNPFHPDAILQTEAHQHPGWRELLAREMTPARSTLTEKVRETQSIKLNVETESAPTVDYKIVSNIVSAGLSPRNSLEVLTPEIPGERDRGNCITSLQLHPKGWATLIRCSSNTDDQEVSNTSLQIHLLSQSQMWDNRCDTSLYVRSPGCMPPLRVLELETFYTCWWGVTKPDW